nr:hypothetical protein [Tanacetum cinerariifolium]
MANVPPNDPNVDAPAIVPAPVNLDHAPAQLIGLGDGFAPHWIGNNIPNNQNGWIEEDAKEEEKDPKEDPEEDPEEEPEDDDDDMEMDDEAEVIDPYMDDGSNNPPLSNSKDEETPPTSPVIPDADGQPIPPIASFGQNFHFGESSSTVNLLTGNSKIVSTGPMCPNLGTVWKRLGKMEKFMSERIDTEGRIKKMFKKTRSSFSWFRLCNIETDRTVRDTPSVSVLKKKAPTTTDRSKGIDLRSEVALLEEAQVKKVLKKSTHETNIYQVGSLSEGADFQSEGDSDDDNDDDDQHGDDDDQHGDDDDQHGDDERTESDNPSSNVTEEQYERINEELYGDVNVSLTDAEPTNKEKDDEEMTVAGHENGNQEVAGDQVKDDAQTTVMATLTTEVPLQSSSISSDYATKFLNFENIPLIDTEIIMANAPPNDPNIDAPAIAPAPVNPDHAPAQLVGLGNSFAPHWIGNNIPNNQNGWIEEDAGEEEEDPEEEPEDDDDDMEMDDEAESEGSFPLPLGSQVQEPPVEPSARPIPTPYPDDPYVVTRDAATAGAAIATSGIDDDDDDTTPMDSQPHEPHGSPRDTQ